MAGKGPKSSGAKRGWRLVWRDEFDRDGLPDPAKWGYETGFVRNQELQCYTARRPENARVENGMLVLEAHKERFANPFYDKNQPVSPRNQPRAQYTSASLTTAQQASWTYGRIEVRAKVPTGRGTRTIWPVPQGATDSVLVPRKRNGF